jgi:ubiquinone/menaquinone biosynthesis C-methylase UbiE
MNRVKLLEAFDLREGVYFQRDLDRNEAFEKKYLAIREKEQRIYTDEQVSNLPEISLTHPHYSEWRIRQTSMHRLVRYINQRGFKTILDIGCGNGWLSSHLAKTRAEVFALDVNEVELTQGSRVYKGTNNLTFIYADVLSNPFKKEKMFDLVVVASSVQYFSDVKALIHCIQPILTDTGEIHILDSPIYQNKNEADLAKKRSEEYFSNMGHSWMSNYYFHHTFEMFSGFTYELLYNPSSLFNRLKNKITKSSPFPWISIGNFRNQ